MELLPCAHSAILKSDKLKCGCSLCMESHRAQSHTEAYQLSYNSVVSHCTVSHGRLSYGSVVYSIRQYHLQCVCHEAAWAAHAALSSVAAFLERYFLKWHLLPTRCPIEPRGNTSQQPLSKDQQDFSSRESTLDFSSGLSQPAFLNGDFHQASLICCFASSHRFTG